MDRWRRPGLARGVLGGVAGFAVGALPVVAAAQLGADIKPGHVLALGYIGAHARAGFSASARSASGRAGPSVAPTTRPIRLRRMAAPATGRAISGSPPTTR